MPVIAVESGERFGQVQDILIDPQERRIAIVSCPARWSLPG
jgi:sporulation protein YlmC with PRC-barrel domain